MNFDVRKNIERLEKLLNFEVKCTCIIFFFDAVTQPADFKLSWDASNDAKPKRFIYKPFDVLQGCVALHITRHLIHSVISNYP